MRLNWFLCHSRSERCLSIQGYEFPLCARCTAIYLGLITGLIIEVYYGLLPPIYVVVYVIMIVPTTVDGATQMIFQRESTNVIRMISGYPAGIGLILLFRTISNFGLYYFELFFIYI
jgi:uncharacterized membrane protein